MDVLVDLDGTLVDPKPGLIGSIQYALDKLGHPVPPADELLWMIGPPLRVSFPKLLGSADRTEEAIAHYRESYFRGGMYDAVVYDGVPAALEALGSAGCRLFVATSKAAPLRPAHPGAFRSRPALRRHPRPRARRHQRPQGRSHRPHHRAAWRGSRDCDHDRRPRVRRAGRRPQRHPYRRRHLGLRQQGGARRRRRRRALRHAARLGLDHPGIDGREGCQRPTISFCRTTRGLPSAISRSTIMRDLPAAWALRRSLRTT